MGAEIADATEGRGRPGGKARTAGATIEPQNSGDGEATSTVTPRFNPANKQRSVIPHGTLLVTRR